MTPKMASEILRSASDAFYDKHFPVMRKVAATIAKRYVSNSSPLVILWSQMSEHIDNFLRGTAQNCDIMLHMIVYPFFDLRVDFAEQFDQCQMFEKTTFQQRDFGFSLSEDGHVKLKICVFCFLMSLCGSVWFFFGYAVNLLLQCKAHPEQFCHRSFHDLNNLVPRLFSNILSSTQEAMHCNPWYFVYQTAMR